MSGARLLRIDSGYYVAGVVLKDDICIYSAPIVRWMRGKTTFDIKRWLDKKKFEYSITEVDE